MFDQISSVVEKALGLKLDADQLNMGQTSLRALVVFLVATAMIRLGNKRFIGKSTAMDVMLGIVFGSVVSRGISGTAPFFPTLAAGATLIAAHWLVSAIGFRSHAFGMLFKGHETLLVRDGQIDRAAMKKSHITEHDLEEALRVHGKPPNVHEIKMAHLERNGDISIL